MILHVGMPDGMLTYVPEVYASSDSVFPHLSTTCLELRDYGREGGTTGRRPGQKSSRFLLGLTRYIYLVYDPR